MGRAPRSGSRSRRRDPALGPSGRPVAALRFPADPPPEGPDPAATPADVAGLVGRDVRIDLAGHALRLSELRARPDRYTRWFEQARRDPGYARCLCRRDGQRLVIREVGVIFHLARWPGSADEHVPGCPFFSTASRHCGATGHREAIEVSEHGTRIAVGFAVTATTADGDDSDGEDRAGETIPVPPLLAGRVSTGSVTMLGLLHWLWESAGLTTWPPDTSDPALDVPTSRGGPSAGHGPSSPPGGRARRSWGDCHVALTRVVASLRLGGHPAPSRLHVVAPYRPEQPDRAREARLAAFLRPLEHPATTTIKGGPRRGRTRQLRHRRLLLAELKDLTGCEHGHKLALRHFPRPVFLTGEQHTNLIRTYSGFSERRGAGARRVILALVEGTPRGWLRLVDVAVMLTSSDYLPADSS